METPERMPETPPAFFSEERMESRNERRSIPRTITPLSMQALDGSGILRFPLKQIGRAHV